MTIESGEKQKNTDIIQEDMRKRYPGLPEAEYDFSQAWKDKVQAEQSPRLKENIKGAGKLTDK